MYDCLIPSFEGQIEQEKEEILQIATKAALEG
jgi:hypothetical protein